MAKLQLSPILSGYTSAAALNNNFQNITDALENCLSRDGTSPNAMLADLDMNECSLLNVSTLNGVEVSTLSSLATVLDAVASYNISYLGAHPSAPTEDNNGNPLLVGALYYNTTSSTLYVWTGSEWDAAAFSVVGGGVTSFSAGDTGLTPSSSSTGAVTLAGTLAVGSGGTGVTSSTGTGSVVLSDSPALVSPTLGTPVSGTLTNCTGLPVAGGGTGATNAATARTNLGVSIGADVQAYVVPGTSGNVLTSNGTAWVSATSSTSSIVSVTTVQTRTQGTYSVPSSGDGTEISPLTMTFTPKKAGNKVILEWQVNGESHNNTAYIVTRNGTRLTDTTDASNNRWACIIAQPFDGDNNSTPDNAIVRIVDNNTLAVATTYRLHVRSSGYSGYVLYLNGTFGTTGAEEYEALLSTATATEINV